jgi:hypothetical protein
VLVALLFLTSTAAFAVGGAWLVGYTGLAVAGIGVALWPVLRPHGPGLATAYLVLRCAEGVVLLATGAQYVPVVYAFSGVGGLVLSVLLLRSGLVPRWLAVLGVIGYATLLAGVVFAATGLSDLDSDFVFFVPGGLFELALPILLLVKGFTKERAHA